MLTKYLNFLVLLLTGLLSQRAAAALNLYFQAYDQSGKALFPANTQNPVPNAIQIQDFSYDIRNTVSAGAAGAGKAVFDSLEIVRNVDIISPTLFYDLAAGIALSRLIISSYKAGTTAFPISVFTYKNAFVQTQAISASLGADNLQENITFVYNTLSFQYQGVNPDGTPGSTNLHTWSVQTNTGS